MDLYLQFGYGMMSLCKDLIKKWNGGTVVLSPRDLSKSQMDKFSRELSSINGRVVIDPQFYLPHANHGRLTSHEFWPNDYNTSLFSKSDITKMLLILKDSYNDKFDSSFFILPSFFGSIINNDWYNHNNLVVEASKGLGIKQERYLTISLSSAVLCSEDQIHLLLEYLEDIDVDGFYVVPEPPTKSYLVDNPIWLLNLLDLCAGMKLLKKKVVVGYSSHQMLCLALTKVDAISSGTWLNVRSFNTDKFNEAEESVSKRSTWYYCPQSLSEYQIPFLDLAQRLGKLDALRTDTSFDSTYSDILFSGAQPSSVNFNESYAFKHYLHCLKVQTSLSAKPTYIDTRESLKMQLETSNILTQDFNKSGIRGRDRDFSKVSDINLSAIDAFQQIRGLIMNLSWNS